MATESWLWQTVNALGGKPATRAERDYNTAVGMALKVIERAEQRGAADAAELLTLLRADGRYLSNKNFRAVVDEAAREVAASAARSMAAAE